MRNNCKNVEPENDVLEYGEELQVVEIDEFFDDREKFIEYQNAENCLRNFSYEY